MSRSQEPTLHWVRQELRPGRPYLRCPLQRSGLPVESKSAGLWLKGSVGRRSPPAARNLDYLPSSASRRQFGPLVNGSLSGLPGFVPGTPFLRALIRLSAPSLLARKEPTRLSNQPIE